MIRKRFDEELEQLNIDLIKMGHLVENAIENMIDAFENQNQLLAKEIMQNDCLINDMERAIESKALSLMLRQQPIATDLRNVTTALKVVTDLERIGDQAADVAEIILNFDSQFAYHIVEHIPMMARKSKIMVHGAIHAFIKKDLVGAKEIVKIDDDIDQLFEKVKEEVVEIIKENSERIDYCLDFLMIAKHLEKAADHAVNICEWLEFNQNGTVNKHRLI